MAQNRTRRSPDGPSPTLPPSRGYRPLTRQFQRPGQHRSHAGDAQCACTPPHRPSLPAPSHGLLGIVVLRPGTPPPGGRVAPRPRGLRLQGRRERGGGGQPRGSLSRGAAGEGRSLGGQAGGVRGAGRRALRVSSHGAAPAGSWQARGWNGAGAFTGEARLSRRGGCPPGINFGIDTKTKALHWLHPPSLQGQRRAGRWGLMAGSPAQGQSRFLPPAWLWWPQTHTKPCLLSRVVHTETASPLSCSWYKYMPLFLGGFWLEENLFVDFISFCNVWFFFFLITRD